MSGTRASAAKAGAHAVHGGRTYTLTQHVHSRQGPTRLILLRGALWAFRSRRARRCVPRRQLPPQPQTHAQGCPVEREEGPRAPPVEQPRRTVTIPPAASVTRRRRARPPPKKRCPNPCHARPPMQLNAHDAPSAHQSSRSVRPSRPSSLAPPSCVFMSSRSSGPAAQVTPAARSARAARLLSSPHLASALDARIRRSRECWVVGYGCSRRSSPHSY